MTRREFVTNAGVLGAIGFAARWAQAQPTAREHSANLQNDE